MSVSEIRDYETPYNWKLITYTPAEMENFRRCGFEMGDEKYRVPYLGVLALAAGAGLDRLDALKVRVGDVTESNGLIAVTVTGSYPRVFPVFGNGPSTSPLCSTGRTKTTIYSSLTSTKTVAMTGRNCPVFCVITAETRRPRGTTNFA